MDLFLILAGVLLCILVLLTLLFRAAERRLVFPPLPDESGDDPKLERTSFGLHYRHPDPYVALLWFPGNGYRGNGFFSSDRYGERIRLLLDWWRIDLIIVDYRSHGPHPTERAILRMADTAREYVRTERPRIPVAVAGHSLGAYAAAYSAAQHGAAPLYLLAPLRSLKPVALRAFPRLSGLLRALFLLPVHRFDTERWLGNAGAGLYTLHGGQDEMIPLSEAEELHASASQPKHLRVFQDAGHLTGQQAMLYLLEDLKCMRALK